MKQLFNCFLVLCLTVFICEVQAQTRRYVVAGGVGSGDGSSWANASANLQGMINASGSGDEIWVANGTYSPSIPADGVSPDPRDCSFVLKANVKIYGGFAGGETSIDERTPAPSGMIGELCILSGDIGIPSNTADNSYHVVISSGNVGTAVLDGFTITGGNSNGAGSISVNSIAVSQLAGGGISIYNYSSPTLTNLTIKSNSAKYGGGMSINNYSLPTLTNVVISGNSAIVPGGLGGGMNNNYYSSPTLTNVVISGNNAERGGGINNDSSSPVLTNVTMSGNHTDYEGPAMYNYGSLSTPVIRNSIIWGNTAATGDPANNVSNLYGVPTYINSLVGGVSASNVINANPQFVSASDYRLQAGSPAINAGNNAFFNVTLLGKTTDLGGKPRIMQRNIDLGAYEFQVIPDGGGIVYVNTAASGNGSGNSWANATQELADALLAAKTNSAVSEIWVAEGTYYPLYNASDGTIGDGERDNAFIISANVEIYGGFPNTGIPGMANRNWYNFPTVLSGNRGALNSNSDNCYHVVISEGIVGTACLNGFTITGGNANGSGSISVNNTMIDRTSGGGVYHTSSSPVLTNIAINGNSANSNGGGMYNENSNPKLTNVCVSGNYSNAFGGGIYNDASLPVLTNVTISGNRANSGGGIYNDSSSPPVNNSIIWGNTATAGVNVFNNVGSTPVYTNSIIQGSGGSLSWDLNFGTDNTGNLDDDPLFVAPAAASSAPTTLGIYRLKSISPAIEAGDNSLYCTARSIASILSTEIDLNGHPRLNGTSIDIGAHEYFLITYIVNFNVANSYGTITATVDGVPIVTGDPVEEGKNVVFTAIPFGGYRVKEWTLDGTVVRSSTTSTYTITSIVAAHTVTVEFEPLPPPPTSPRITGSADMTVTVGYSSTSTAPFTITGTSPVTVQKISGDDHIMWNNTTRTLDIAAGLPVGEYKVVLKATNIAATFQFVFTLTVKAVVYFVELPKTFDGGIVTVNVPYYAEAGELITLTIIPNAGYELDAIYVVGLNDRNIIVPLEGTGSTRTFIMPAHHIAIVAVFRPITVANEQLTASHEPLKAFAHGGVWYVSGIADGAMLRVYNVQGNLVYQGETNGGKAEIWLPGNGVYIVTDGKDTVKIIAN